METNAYDSDVFCDSDSEADVHAAADAAAQLQRRLAQLLGDAGDDAAPRALPLASPVPAHAVAESNSGSVYSMDTTGLNLGAGQQSSVASRLRTRLQKTLAAGTSAAAAEARAGTQRGTAATSPHSRESVTAALLANRKVQEALILRLRRVEELQQQNAEKQRVLKETLAQQKRGPAAQFVRLRRETVLAEPWFVSEEGTRPDPSRDSVLMSRVLGGRTLEQCASPALPWSTEEVQALRCGLVTQLKERVLMEVAGRGHGAEEKSASEVVQMIVQQARKWKAANPPTVEPVPGPAAAAATATVTATADLRTTLDALPDHEYLLFGDYADFGHIATQYVPTRTAEDCRIRFMNNDDPRINLAPFTKDEERRLLSLAQDVAHKPTTWAQVAIELGTNRTAMQCFQKYQRSLNANLLKNGVQRSWTKEEDAELAQAVAQHGASNWRCIASCLKGRTAEQCNQRWIKAGGNKRKTGQWGTDEHDRLRAAVALYEPSSLPTAAAASSSGDNSGGQGGVKRSRTTAAANAKTLPWSLIQQHVPGRTDVQCRERWVCATSSQVHHLWTGQEDASLLRAAGEQQQQKWSVVAKAVGTGRTPRQCYRRWQRIVKKSDPQKFMTYKQNQTIQSMVLPGHFTHKQGEKSLLQAQDVADLPFVGRLVNPGSVPQEAGQESTGGVVEESAS